MIQYPFKIQIQVFFLSRLCNILIFPKNFCSWIISKYSKDQYATYIGFCKRCLMWGRKTSPFDKNICESCLEEVEE